MSIASKTEISPTYLLIGIAHYLPKGRKCFRDTPNDRLHNFFYQEKERHPKVLGHLKFEWDRSYPFCRGLYNAISNMVVAGTINRASPALLDCYFDEVCEGMYQRAVSQIFPKEVLSEIEQIADSFNQHLAIDEKIRR